MPRRVSSSRVPIGRTTRGHVHVGLLRVFVVAENSFDFARRLQFGSHTTTDVMDQHRYEQDPTGAVSVRNASVPYFILSR
jgi:hypothetical protein